MKNISPRTWVKVLKAKQYNDKKYKKGEGQLRIGKTQQMCCLGVLADIREMKWVKDSGDNETPKGCVYLGEGMLATHQLPRWLGYDQMCELAKLNDSTKTWDDVVVYIEEIIIPQYDELRKK